MLILTKAILTMMIGFIISVIFGIILIPMLKRMKVKQKISIFLNKAHKKKDGIPTMGGIIFIIPTIITMFILLLLGKIQFTQNLLIVLFVFVAYALIGFIDDFIIIKKGKNEGLTEIQKLFGQLVVAIIFFIIFLKSGHETALNIHTLNIRIDMGWFYGLFLLFVLVASSNAVNLTDGLDGLAGGLSAIAFLAFGIISWGSTWAAGHEEIAIFCFTLVGSLLGFLVFNSYPAKVFMGDTGSLSLGATLASVAILTNHEITLIIVAGVFVIETLTCIIQTVSMVFFHKKIFLMTPIHHHFEKMGHEESDIVKGFWVLGLILSMLGILFGVWL